jgi:hypothetical protein
MFSVSIWCATHIVWALSLPSRVTGIWYQQQTANTLRGRRDNKKNELRSAFCVNFHGLIRAKKRSNFHFKRGLGCNLSLHTTTITAYLTLIKKRHTFQVQAHNQFCVRQQSKILSSPGLNGDRGAHKSCSLSRDINFMSLLSSSLAMRAMSSIFMVRLMRCRVCAENECRFEFNNEMIIYARTLLRDNRKKSQT